MKFFRFPKLVTLRTGIRVAQLESGEQAEHHLTDHSLPFLNWVKEQLAQLGASQSFEVLHVDIYLVDRYRGIPPAGTLQLLQSLDEILHKRHKNPSIRVVFTIHPCNGVSVIKQSTDEVQVQGFLTSAFPLSESSELLSFVRPYSA